MREKLIVRLVLGVRVKVADDDAERLEDAEGVESLVPVAEGDTDIGNVTDGVITDLEVESDWLSQAV